MTDIDPQGIFAPSGAGAASGPSHWRIVTIGALGLASVFAITAPPAFAGPIRSTGAAGPSPTYVALGDSFTAGPDVPAQLTSATSPSAPNTCLRSSHNYASLTSAALGLSLTDRSCSSATTKALTLSQGPGIPAQLTALGPNTSVVSLGIGGNDLGFSTIARNCVAGTPWGGTRVGWSCTKLYSPGGVNQLAATIRQVGSAVATSLTDIRERAPHARVFVVGYPDVVPPDGSGCWPRLPYSAHDLGFLRGVESDLNATLAADAGAAGDVFVDMAKPSADHSGCASAASRWVEPLLASRGTFPLHPTAVGMAGMAKVLEAGISGRAPIST
jgi:lysophospholipase L1-like esterase